LQLWLPLLDWNLPVLHDTQPAVPALSLNWPLGHDLHVPVLPPPQPEWYRPAAQW
jgi:hypothetical protein